MIATSINQTTGAALSVPVRQTVLSSLLDALGLPAFIAYTLATDSVPTMTSNTTPSGTVIASASSNAYKAFDDNVNTAWEHNATTSGKYTGYDWGAGISKSSNLFSLTLNGYNPILTINYQGYDGSTWTTLGTFTTAAGKHYYGCTNTTGYRGYRVYVPSSCGTWDVNEMEIFENVPSSLTISAASTPLVLTAANGFGAAGAVDRVGIVSVDTAIGNFNTAGTPTVNYLYGDIAANGSVTFGSTTLARPVFLRSLRVRVVFPCPSLDGGLWLL